ncbi:MAG: hypothetical protein GVY32_01095 [Gammaproteobacteria bacterium]|jgi:hypothetical protein|nr:hypothetical protein [Gammaproteobacteria bacterium]
MKTRVLFIGGCGRSGSTLLSVFLNAHPGMVSVGELKFLPEWIARDAPCTCGRPVSACEFWRDIAAGLAGRRRAESGESGESATRLGDEELSEVIEAVRDRTGCRVIVDSSKTVADLDRLKRREDIDLYVIHLVRDGRGYLRSRTKPVKHSTVRPEVQEPVSAVKAIGRWLATNLEYSRQDARLPPDRLMRVRYEDFVRDPESELARICGFVGLEFDPAMLEDGMHDCHDIGGNGWRYAQSSAIRLELDESWRRRLSPWQKLLFAVGASWLNRRYGY